MLMNADSLNIRFNDFERKLHIAQRALLRRQRRLIVFAAIQRAATFGLPIAALAMFVAFCKTTGWVPSATAWIIAGVSVFVWVCFLGHGLWLCWNTRADLVDTAERMDHAAGSKNRFATALEFKQLHLDDGFAGLAIDDALAHAASTPAVHITLPRIDRSPKAIYQTIATIACLLLCAAAMLVLATHVPDQARSPAVTLAGRSYKSLAPALLPDDPITLARATNGHTTLPESKTGHADEPSDTKTPGVTPPSDPQTASASAAAAQSASAAGDAGGQGNSSSNATGLPATPSPTADQAHALAALPSLVADAGADPQTNSANSNGSPSPAGSGDEVKVTGKADGQNQSGGQNPDNKPVKNGKEGNADGGNARNQRTDSHSTAHNAQGMENTDSTGGHGSGSGQSGGKKSRGARTTLLGVRTPDLFKGQDHPGPEQQTFLPADPTPTALNPAADAPANSRHGDEQIQHMTQLDPQDDSLINQYFNQMHGNR